MRAFYFLAFLLISCPAVAATQSVTARIAFGVPAAIHQVQTALAQSGGVTYGTGGIVISGTQDQAVSLFMGDYVSDAGVSLGDARCAYDGASAGACDIAAGAPGAGKALKFSVRPVAGADYVSGAPAAPSFTLMVVYQ